MFEKATSSAEVSEKPIELTPLSSAVGLDLDNLASGNRWRGRYLVNQQLADITYGKIWAATEVETGREVFIRSFRVNDDLRQRAWFSLTQYQGKGITPMIESGEQEGRRFEVVSAPPGKTLANWANGRAMGLAELKPIVQQLSSLIVNFHGLGVVHLNLNLHTVFIEEKPEGNRIVISGLESAQDITRESLVSIHVNPFYAPPEAVGLYQHHCGPTLRAWDWWSLGRMAQELTLGKHVIGSILGRDVTRHTPELLMRAEQFLKENEADKPRAGAVEKMGELNPALTRLLRGLLASNRDGRWGARDVEAWLRGETPKERYHLPRQERLFLWRDDVYSVAEAAEMFSSAEYWNDGVAEIFDQKNPATLIRFLLDDVASRKTSARIADLLKLADTSAFAACTAEATREVILGIVWAMLGAGHVPMRWRGLDVNATWLTNRLKPEAQPDGLSQVRAMIEETSIKQIALVDADAARVLGEFARLAQGALMLAQSHQWVVLSDAKDVASLWSIAQNGESALRAQLAAARERYAVSRDEALNDLFNRNVLDETELVVLARTLADVERFKYVTHEVWSAELYSKIRDEGLKVVRAESWFALGASIRLGAVVLGPVPVFLSIWLASSASVALAYPSRPTLALALSVLGLGYFLRGASKRLIQKELRRHDLMWDGILKFSGSRCEENGLRCVPHMSSVSQKILHLRWLELNRQVGTLRGKTVFQPLPAAAKFGFFKAVALLSAAAFLAITGTLGYHSIKHPPTLPALKLAWVSPLPKLPSRGESSAATKSVAVDAKGQPVLEDSPKAPEDEAVSERSAKVRKAVDDPHIVRQMSWNFAKVDDAQHVTVINELTATPEQTEAAMDAGQAAAKPYRASTISGLIAVQVPMDEGIGLMLYDGQAAKVSDKHVFKIAYVPLARTWLQLGDHRAIYLGDN